jgi:LacI family transcriptional regulator
MRKKKKIVLALPIGVPHLEQVLHGIRLYSQAHKDWDFITSPETHSIPVSSLVGWDGDGAIAMVNSLKDVEVIQTLKCPVINISGALDYSGIPRVRIDYMEAGRKAARHLLEHGFSRFAFYGLKNVFYAKSEYQGFIEVIKSQGYKCSYYEDTPTFAMDKPWQHDHVSLERWLQSLEKPVGLMASHDPRAAMVIQACKRCGIKVPDEIAVIGFNNDIQTCEFSDPQITSVARPGEKVGWLTAELLDSLISGKTPQAAEIVIPPGEVVERLSTDTIGVDNKLILEVVNNIKRHINEPISVNSIAVSVGRSRRWLEYAFREYLRVTPHEFITNIRFKRAKFLLETNPKISIKELAYECGFSGSRQLNLVFEKQLGVSAKLFKNKLLESLELKVKNNIPNSLTPPINS